MADITLVNLRVKYLENSKKIAYTPVGVLYIISSLEKAGFSVDFKDYQFNSYKNQYDPQNLVKFLKNSADIVGLSFSVEFLPFALIGIKKLKEKFPEKTIIVGGPAINGIEEEVMRNFPQIGVIVRGEGEKTIVELMNAIKQKNSLRKVKGITYGSNGRVISNFTRERTINLDEFPSPINNSIDLSNYNTFHISSSRGCIFKCVFCGINPQCNNKVTFRSIERVVNEINFVVSEYKPQLIRMVDDNFALNKKRVIALCREIRKQKIDANFGCSASVNCMDKRLMEELSGSDFKRIYYGIESASNNVLKRINKPFTIELAEKVIDKSMKYFDDTLVSFVWGFPFESIADFRKTMFLRTLYNGLYGKRIRTQLHLCSPLANSALYHKYRHSIKFDEGIVSDISNQVIFNLSASTKKEIISLIKKFPLIFPSFYYYPHKGFAEKMYLLKRVARNYFEQKKIRS
ncbi:MAG: radical SAM protein [Candidatus Diapherotrites archaeon]